MKNNLKINFIERFIVINDNKSSHLVLCIVLLLHFNEVFSSKQSLLREIFRNVTV